jgi:NAD(P)-dependent dehydrogenase (short-subunit alcohol dehydrogenase family)
VGRAIVQSLAAGGATVAVHHHGSGTAAAELVSELKAQGRRAQAFAADLTDDAQLERLAQEVEAALGPVSVLVNSAARFTRADLLDTTPAMLDAAWRLNARAPFLLTRALARGMVARREGVVVNVLDIGGAFLPTPHYAAYGMTKAAMRMLTELLAVELAPYVRVNGVAPGRSFRPNLRPRLTGSGSGQRIPLQRFGRPEEVAATVRFLVTGPDFITGQIVAVDGVPAPRHPTPGVGPGPGWNPARRWLYRGHGHLGRFPRNPGRPRPGLPSPPDGAGGGAVEQVQGPAGLRGYYLSVRVVPAGLQRVRLRPESGEGGRSDDVVGDRTASALA